MILNELNKRPIISFGLGRIELTVPVGEIVTIWQNEMFNTSSFNMYHDGDRKDNVHHFDFEAPAVGEYFFEVTIVNTRTEQERISNKIKLIVV